MADERDASSIDYIQEDDCRLMRTILANSRDGIRVYDLVKGRHTYINSVHADLLTYTPSEIAAFSNKDILAHVHPEDVAGLSQQFLATMTGGQSIFDAEYRWRCKDGSYRWLSDHGQLVLDEAGRSAAVISTTRDISDRKQMETELTQALSLSDKRMQELQAVIMSIPDGLIIFGSDGNPIFYNEMGKQVFDAFDLDTGRSIFKQTLPSYIFSDGQPIGDVGQTRLYASLRNGEAVRNFRVESRRDPAHPVTYSLSSAAAYDSNGGMVGAVVAFRDVTKAIAAQNEVRASREQALALVAKLQQEDANKTRFLGVLSHELRNPLATIMMSLSLQDRPDATPEQVRKARDVAQRQLDHLTRLVDDLLDVTRITENKIKLKLQQVELVDFLSRHIQDYQVFFDERNIRLALLLPDGPVIIEADPARLNQVLGNLLYNAGKFTSPGGSVTVRLRTDASFAEPVAAPCEPVAGDRMKPPVEAPGSAPETRQEAVIEVSDTGIGIDRETLASLFTPFTQADRSLSRSMGGLGLGLSIVKGMVELHGGCVQAFSEGIGLGATFSVRLPLFMSTAIQQHAARRNDMPNAYGTLKVLVIEDNPDLLEILGDLVTLLGHEVATATSGRDGIEQALSFRPDVITCDIGLPDISGYDVAKMVRSHPELKDTLMIAMSGYAQPDDLERSRAAGFNRHLAKPVSIDTLSEAIRECQRILAKGE